MNTNVINKIKKIIPLNFLHKSSIELLNKINGPIGIACSGGVDSVALIYLIYYYFPHLQNKIIIFYYNHNILNLNYQIQCANVISKISQELKLEVITDKLLNNINKTIHKENFLRQKRHNFYLTSLNQIKSNYLLIGHQANDVAENILMRLSRGSGLEGLSSPKPINSMLKNKIYIRPLINIKKQYLIEMMSVIDKEWIEDYSNSQNFCYRNCIRNLVINQWEKCYKNCIYKGILRSRTLIEEDFYALEWVVKKINYIKIQKNVININLKFRKFPKAIIRRILNQFLLNNNLTPLKAKILDRLICNITHNKNCIFNINNFFQILLKKNLLIIKKNNY